ncbi:PTS sugar transporter subunit IIA [Facklamia miroungae]|uniref:PTS system, galactitol-specific IIA component n=1 Tax=Facklamia miroungae TaxID=120956 RepID=A0A1G7RVX0_9LACT|nr:PTS sugar transporter subunit IIA [Facklamia miroungae]NKZ29255.1 PTS sugar transporter subunit IIA [Facklamia miroungae]SDG14888.1 PTS system, galactitol-specific IIA component [Facklamia miroungae]
MSIRMNLKSELMLNQLDVNSKEEALSLLAKKLKEEGMVKEEYIEAIIEREREYPTGLPSAQPAVAIPHANHDLVKKTSMAVATLAKPVNFKNMENITADIPVQIIMMLAIAEPEGQIEMLQKVISFIQNEDMKNNLLQAENNEEMLKIIQKIIEN